MNPFSFILTRHYTENIIIFNTHVDGDVANWLRCSTEDFVILANQ